MILPFANYLAEDRSLTFIITIVQQARKTTSRPEHSTHHLRRLSDIRFPARIPLLYKLRCMFQILNRLRFYEPKWSQHDSVIVNMLEIFFDA